ncbi:hypothetical protein TSTA_126360 [Talaromyces stipitatus ATCC 10500]|uniref:Uncharacterized protein n=1 Tax=Talaromyces stipitatus (strain ATCC 10500 / CBS 375.48 / QM 6759 / NRRL 1006) TaxID=441959 RepID=B8MBD9_TALSN|nr:uncharacterized protein TSTA_126360 [Talaromyces stipitatus ATCC 10500]EED18928.1 hypothetical protein TSTA_126360 [Talaromyces stipitatus ATCC 10500]
MPNLEPSGNITKINSLEWRGLHEISYDVYVYITEGDSEVTSLPETQYRVSGRVRKRLRVIKAKQVDLQILIYAPRDLMMFALFYYPEGRVMALRNLRGPGRGPGRQGDPRVVARSMWKSVFKQRPEQ